MFYNMIETFEEFLGNDNRVEEITFKYHMLEKNEKLKLNQYQKIIR